MSATNIDIGKELKRIKDRLDSKDTSIYDVAKQEFMTSKEKLKEKLEQKRKELKASLEDQMDEYAAHVSNASLALVDDLYSWYKSIKDNPIDTICCVIRYFLTLSTNLNGLMFLIGLLQLLRGLLRGGSTILSLKVDIFDFIQRMLGWSLFLSLDIILSMLKKALMALLDMIAKPLTSNKLLEECFHISIVFAAIEKFISEILDINFDAMKSLLGMLDELLDLGDQLTLSASSDIFDDLAKLLEDIIRAAYGLIGLIEEYDICNILQINADPTAVSTALEKAYSEISSDESEWWGDIIATPAGDFRIPSEKLLSVVIRETLGKRVGSGTILYTQPDVPQGDVPLGESMFETEGAVNFGRIDVDYLNDCMDDDTLIDLIHKFAEDNKSTTSS